MSLETFRKLPSISGIIKEQRCHENRASNNKALDVIDDLIVLVL